MNKIIKYFIFRIKLFLSPIKTIVKYPHINFQGKVILSECEIDDNVKIYHNTIISNTKILKYSYVGGNSKIMNATIGQFCSLGPNLKIGLGMHPTDYISTYPGFYSKKASGSYSLYIAEDIIEHKLIIIKNDVWIGDNSTILDGVTIGNGAVIAAGSVVTKDVPDYAIVGGVPAKIIKYRFSEVEIAKLLSIGWWNKEIDYIKDNAELFLKPKDFFNDDKY